MTNYNRNAATAISRRRVAEQREQRDIAARALIAAARLSLVAFESTYLMNNAFDQNYFALRAADLRSAITTAEAAFALPEAQPRTAQTDEVFIGNANDYRIAQGIPGSAMPEVQR